MKIPKQPFAFILPLLCLLFLHLPGRLNGQTLVAVGANRTETTAYPATSPNDPIYYFCTQAGNNIAALTGRSAGGTVLFTWEKLDPVARKFAAYSNETGTSSTISRLADGCYRLSFTENGTTSQFRAWVFNSWNQPVAAITSSTCTALKLAAATTGIDYRYYDLTSGAAVTLAPQYSYKWYVGTALVSSAQNPTISNPPSQNTTYRVELTDRSGCMRSAEVNYLSPIPVAKFTWSTPQQMDPQYVFPQAPADIDFKNQSENSDPDKYEWYLFKDKNILEAMGGGTAAIDSFQEVLYEVNPLYTYQLSGKYRVKLVASKTVQSLTCRDTFYLPDYIIVDTSLVKVAPVFTPNGDGINDKLMLKARSLESLDFTIFNRWGKVVHHFSTNNFLPTDSEIAAWDGRVNGNLCTPGVYFFVVDAKGRDGERRRSKGFVEMIW